MKKYKVWATITTCAYLDVCAKSADEALRKARSANESEFTRCEGEFEIENVVED